MARLGKAATLARRVMKPGSGSAFGPSTRAVGRSLSQASVQNLMSRTENMSMGAKADCLSQQTSFSSAGFASAISECRRLMRLANAKRKERQADLLVTLEKWQTAELGKRLEPFLNLVPVLRADQHQLKPIPSASGACAFDMSAAPAKCPTLAAGWASGSQTTNLAQGLERDWIERHKSVQHVGAAPILQPIAKQSPCTSGACLHTAAGQQKQKLVKSVLSKLKACFNSKAKKKLLGEGGIVLCFNTGDSDPGLCIEPDEDMAVWMHVAAMYWKPYRPTFGLLERVNGSPADNDENTHVYLEVLGAENHNDP
eukprot:6491583-Amphidinium_carterae.2